MTDDAADTPAPAADEVARARAALDNALVEIVRLAEERDSLEHRLRESARMLRETLARKVEREVAVEDLQRQLAEERRLHAAAIQAREMDERRDLLLSRTADGIREFQTRFNSELWQYQTQRAWKIMLWFRLAYSSMLRRGWRGRLQFARDLLGLRRPVGSS